MYGRGKNDEAVFITVFIGIPKVCKGKKKSKLIDMNNICLLKNGFENVLCSQGNTKYIHISY